MTVSELQELSIYPICLEQSKLEHPNENEDFHIYNACSAAAASISQDAFDLCTDLDNLAKSYKNHAFDDEDLEIEEDSEHCGLEPDNTGGSGGYDDWEDGEVSHQFSRTADTYHDEPYHKYNELRGF